MGWGLSFWIFTSLPGMRLLLDCEPHLETQGHGVQSEEHYLRLSRCRVRRWRRRDSSLLEKALWDWKTKPATAYKIHRVLFRITY